MIFEGWPSQISYKASVITESIARGIKKIKKTRIIILISAAPEPL